MNLSNARATFGLQAKATPVKAGTKGTVQIGANNETISLPYATKIISFDAVIVGGASNLIIDMSDLDNTGSTAWTAGAAQVENATAAGTISASGNATVTVTAAGMTGSPKAISVAVVAADTATVWAGKVRAALAADAAVSALFSVSGATTAIILTRKSLTSYTVNGIAVPTYPANDGTLNIALNNGTCTGITTAASSANTTAGVLTVGTYCPDLDGTDFEGEVTIGVSLTYGIEIQNSSFSTDYAKISQGTALVNYAIYPIAKFQVADSTGNILGTDITISVPSDSALVTVTIAGE